MRARTFMPNEWIEIHDNGYIYDARVFLTGKNEAHMEVVRGGKKSLFKVDANLLKSGELEFFERVMETAEEV